MRGRSIRGKAAVVGLAGAALVAASAAGAAITEAQQVPRPRGTPVPRAGARPAAVPTPTQMPCETPAQYRDRVTQTLKPGITHDIATETRGKAINVGGKRVQLPPDAYVEGEVLSVTCVIKDRCPETPFYNIRRGEGKTRAERAAVRKGWFRPIEPLAHFGR